MAKNDEAAKRELKDARRDADDARRRNATWTDEVDAANARVIEAEKNVSWWRRGL